MPRITFVALLLFLLPSYAIAGPYAADIFVENGYGHPQTYYCTPEGNGSSQSYPRVGVQIFDDLYPISGILPEHIRLFIRSHSTFNGMVWGNRLCQGGYIQAESWTNSNGTAYFPAPPYALFGNSGDNAYQFDVEVYNTSIDQWERFFPENNLWGYPQKIYWITADLRNANNPPPPEGYYEGDGIVNLVDLSKFSELFHSDEYHRAIDFYADGDIDLTDVQIFAAAFGESCAKKLIATRVLSKTPGEVIDMVADPDHPLWGVAVPVDEKSWGTLKSNFQQ